METPEQQSKISGIGAACMIGVCLIFDGIDAPLTFLDIAFGAGEFIKPFNNAIASTILFLWVTMKGVKATWTMVGAGLELIPLGNALPIRTVTMATTIYLDWHPKTIIVVKKVAPVVARTVLKK